MHEAAMKIRLPLPGSAKRIVLSIAYLATIAVSIPTSIAQSVTCTGNKEYCDAMKVCEGYSSREGRQECMDTMYWTPLRSRQATSGRSVDRGAENPTAGVTSSKNPTATINGKAINTCSHGGLCMGELLRHMGVN